MIATGSQELAMTKEVEYGAAVVPHRRQETMGQSVNQPRPVGDLLVPTALLLVVARGGRQRLEHWQGPIPSRPGSMAQPR